MTSILDKFCSQRNLSLPIFLYFCTGIHKHNITPPLLILNTPCSFINQFFLRKRCCDHYRLLEINSKIESESLYFFSITYVDRERREYKSRKNFSFSSKRQYTEGKRIKILWSVLNEITHKVKV